MLRRAALCGLLCLAGTAMVAAPIYTEDAAPQSAPPVAKSRTASPNQASAPGTPAIGPEKIKIKAPAHGDPHPITIQKNQEIIITLFGEGMKEATCDPPTNPANGDKWVTANGGMWVTRKNSCTNTYRPKLDSTDDDSFTFKVTDKEGKVKPLTAKATIKIAPGPAGNPPPQQLPPPPPITAKPPAEAVSTQPGKPKLIILQANIEDNVIFEIVKGPQNGDLRLGGDKNNEVTYTPFEGASGEDSFDFTARIGDGPPSQPATVNITIAPIGQEENSKDKPNKSSEQRPETLDQHFSHASLPTLIAIGLSLFTMLWAVYLLLQVQSLHKTVDQQRTDAMLRERDLQAETESIRLETDAIKGKLKSLEKLMAIYIPAKKPSDFAREQGKPKSDPPPTPRSGTTLRPSAPDPLPEPQRFADLPVGPPAPPAYIPPPPRWQKTGKVASDYNNARALGADGPEFFMTHYHCHWLSCENLTDRRSDPSADLYLSEVARGVFLGVEHAGEMWVVPAFYIDLSARSSLEGVFNYRGEAGDANTLICAARVRRSASGFLLTDADTGEIGHA